MLVAAAVCPCPPLLVPDVAAGAAPELDAARAACTDALGVLAAARPDRLVVVGPAGQDGRGPHPEGSRGSFRGFGVDLDVRLGGNSARLGGDRATASEDPAAFTSTPSLSPERAGRVLPPSLAVAAWLLARTDWSDAPVEGLGVGEPLAAERCIQAGRDIAAQTGRVALLVMGDASACRTLKAPGYLDERAAGFDAEVARALGAADVAALKALDAELAYVLQASGWASWQVLAGAAEEAGLGGALLYVDAPYGVGYMVAAWS
ncbi:class III extradiol dioxygenase subunit B-like domain-containing protein [Streptomyces sp. Qhu-G9]|uniref:class III extradiol dioxygenase subunit B-like domain-containing protein n=1 Tax=Streptomyces sp. Qhu-G9 TaxID=3452799 RepID=UPI0022AC2DF1|nr:class III extradiol dioxygenase subunit B-like domain-containing protein [Streptomyces aurantiacus]WAU84491.1 class III extradiol dioxygenase subunit B-like domain-containing protein [Streptomyces aurantiacus]